MKPIPQRNWPISRPSRRTRFTLDQTTALGGLTLALFTYIVLHFIYPLLAKGLLW